MTKSFRSLLIAIGVAAFGSFLAILVSYAATWTGPTATAPNDNTDTPLNVGFDDQTKFGDLDVGGLSTGDIVATGDQLLFDRMAIGGAAGDLTDPANFPTEALEVWGKIELKGSALEGDPFVTAITNLDAPIAPRDAANKKYVDDQVALAAGGGGLNLGPTITLFGTAPITTNYYLGGGSFRGPSGGVPPGCHTGQCKIQVPVFGGMIATFAPPAPGTGTPACSSLDRPETDTIGSWVEIFAGYGPHETIQLSFGQGSNDFATNPNPNNFLLELLEEFTEASIASNAVSISDSVCSSAVAENVNVVATTLNLGGGGQAMNTGGVNSACSLQGCNTCRICAFVPSP